MFGQRISVVPFLKLARINEANIAELIEVLCICTVLVVTIGVGIES